MMRGVPLAIALAAWTVAVGGLAHSAAAGAPTAPAAAPVPAPSSPVDFAHLPWKDGESLTYLVSAYNLVAAEGTFTAHQKVTHWEFDLDLKSGGWVNTFYPFTAQFWCILAPDLPWRSLEFGEYRFEPKRTIRERTRVDYAAHQATREDWARGKTKTYSIAENAVDDIGTMLYHLRTVPWKVGDKRTAFVYESDSEKQGEATCVARETRAFGIWPAQPVMKISILPGQGTHHKGHLTIWMTDDARHLPLHAELEFRYGTFDMDLTKMVNVATP
jgi:hypothetical protein